MNAPFVTSLPDSNCFLCDPPSDLVFRETEHFIALAGLGPVVDGYCVVAAKAHTRSMADIPRSLKLQRSSFVNSLRQELTAKFGSCLITEHGRMAVCSSGEHDHHCFHAHFLFFPGAPDIAQNAASYFLTVRDFDNLEEALQAGSQLDEYLLVSPSMDQYSIFATPLHAPRQLARLLVAFRIGNLELADWKLHPNRETSVRIANTLRLTKLGESSRC
jgi:diadenosine tetraphosphate (Ap4A) HIT family hydrolase